MQKPPCAPYWLTLSSPPQHLRQLYRLLFRKLYPKSSTERPQLVLRAIDLRLVNPHRPATQPSAGRIQPIAPRLERSLVLVVSLLTGGYVLSRLWLGLNGCLKVRYRRRYGALLGAAARSHERGK